MAGSMEVSTVALAVYMVAFMAVFTVFMEGSMAYLAVYMVLAASGVGGNSN